MTYVFVCAKNYLGIISKGIFISIYISSYNAIGLNPKSVILKILKEGIFHKTLLSSENIKLESKRVLL